MGRPTGGLYTDILTASVQYRKAEEIFTYLYSKQGLFHTFFLSSPTEGTTFRYLGIY
jgi:hypothetical protein